MIIVVNNQISQDVYFVLGLNVFNSNVMKKKNMFDQVDFLCLMIEQLQYQDLLKLMDNMQMVVQMVQMFIVQGIIDLNKMVKGFQELMVSDQVLCGVVLVGYQVLVLLEKLVLEKEGSVEGMVVVLLVGIIIVDIIDVIGVKVILLSVEVKVVGEIVFQWDGKDVNGKCMELGKYFIVVNYVDIVGKSIKLFIYVQVLVESVIVGFDGLYLNLKGLGMVLIDYVFCVS